MCAEQLLSLYWRRIFWCSGTKSFSRNTVLFRYRTVFFGENVCAKEKPSKAFKSKDRKKITAKGQGKEEEKNHSRASFPKYSPVTTITLNFMHFSPFPSFPPPPLFAAKKFA